MLDAETADQVDYRSLFHFIKTMTEQSVAPTNGDEMIAIAFLNHKHSTKTKRPFRLPAQTHFVYKMSGNGREWGDIAFGEFLETKAVVRAAA